MDNTPYTQTARKIPQKVRDERILTDLDPISIATPSAKDKNMMMLAKIWYEFIEPLSERNFDCPKCMAGILSNYKQLKPTLIQLSQEEQMISSL